MKLGSLCEQNENRVAITPSVAKNLIKLGCSIVLEHNYGNHLFDSALFTDVGVEFGSKQDVLKAGCLVQVSVPKDSIAMLPADTVLLALTKPFQDKDVLNQLASQRVTTLSMEFVPRSTRAQKMDAISSQANLAGYVAVILASQRLDSIMPMMMTPAGTLPPAKVFIIGAGVAGLQAIATARRMGANVTAFDTRPVAEEQVRSLGASFLKIDLGETGQTDQGYAKELTQEQLDMQREMMKKTCATSDVVITTAQVFGRKAPVIVTADMVSSMKKGSVIVDCATSTGGNVEGIEPGQVVEKNGIHLIGTMELSREVANHASEMYASNIYNFLAEFLTKEEPISLTLDTSDDIIASMLTIQNGELVQPMLLDILNKQGVS
ncbi:MAG: NAD(P)(+) transhydrogenase (Re/Si-specific) subunit alpha [Rickettsiales bacterium]|nr:NAD(P)(+) transhydrogenase (Re/Si-specific) subunit alpha [Rickettsiales bacterium]|tara:strand:+ start:40064 stop:41197 length:1134 start_codon:yes stop_codon:yes gene_type:complete